MSARVQGSNVRNSATANRQERACSPPLHQVNTVHRIEKNPGTLIWAPRRKARVSNTSEYSPCGTPSLFAQDDGSKSEVVKRLEF